MKNVLRCSIIALFSAVLLFCINYTVKADDLSISKYSVNAHLLNDGSLDIQEDLTFDFDKSFNGVYRDINLNGIDGIENLTISRLASNKAVLLKKVSGAKNGDTDVYELLHEKNDNLRIKIYSPSEDESKTFRLSYRLKNVAIKFNDVGELYYKFWGDESDTAIDNFTIFLTLPSPVNKNDLHVFAHGPEDGMFDTLNGSMIKFYIPHVSSRTFVETRIVFPSDIIAISNNIRNTNGLQGILNEEAGFKKVREAKALKNTEMKKIFNIICIGFSVLSILILIIIPFKFKREEADDYLMSVLPDECTPAVASYLYNRVLGAKDIFATLLDLWRKGYINMEEAPRNPDFKLGFGQKPHTEFKIIKIKDADDFLLEHEKYMMKWLFEQLGNGKYIYTYEIEKSAATTKSYTYMNTWYKKVREEAKSRGYFDKEAFSYGITLLFFSVLQAVASIIGIAYKSMYGISGLILSIVTVIAAIILMTRRSDYGYSKFLKWKQFKKYMEDFHLGIDQEKFSKDILIPYATALGVSEKSMKRYNSYLKNEYNDTSSWIVLYLLFDQLDSKNTFAGCFYSSFGASSNGTGGFTSGGGGGAGGGGAGGF